MQVLAILWCYVKTFSVLFTTMLSCPHQPLPVFPDDISSSQTEELSCLPWAVKSVFIFSPACCSFQWIWSSLCYCWVRLNSNAASSFTELTSFLQLVFQSLEPNLSNSATCWLCKHVSIQSALRNLTKI